MIEELGYDQIWRLNDLEGSVSSRKRQVTWDGLHGFQGNVTCSGSSKWLDQVPILYSSSIFLWLFASYYGYIPIDQWCLPVLVVCTDTILRMTYGVVWLQDSLMFLRWRRWWSPTTCTSLLLWWGLCLIFCMYTLYSINNSCIYLD